MSKSAIGQVAFNLLLVALLSFQQYNHEQFKQKQVQQSQDVENIKKLVGMFANLGLRLALTDQDFAARLTKLDGQGSLEDLNAVKDMHLEKLLDTTQEDID